MHCIALSGGVVYSWGENDNNQLGRKTTPTNRAMPVLRQDNGASLSGITQITSGDKHSLAIDGNGNVWSWGGDWGNGQRGQGRWSQDDNATKVLGGASGETYLGDKDPIISVAAGQAHSMAVSKSGKVYVWGSDHFFNGTDEAVHNGGQLGQNCTIANGGKGTNDGANAKPMIAQKADGSTFSDAVAISDGDAWTFVVTKTGEVWVAGFNEHGEAGMGATKKICRFTKMTIPNCRIGFPCPDPDLGPDLQVCPTFSQVLSAGTVYPGFRVTWSRGGTTVRTYTNPYSVSGAPVVETYTATVLGTYTVTIEDIRGATERPCNPCPTVSDDINITQLPAPFSDPGDNTFCGSTLTAHVAGKSTGLYEWYAAATGEPPLPQVPHPISQLLLTHRV